MNVNFPVRVEVALQIRKLLVCANAKQTLSRLVAPQMKLVFYRVKLGAKAEKLRGVQFHVKVFVCLRNKYFFVPKDVNANVLRDAR